MWCIVERKSLKLYVIRVDNDEETIQSFLYLILKTHFAGLDEIGMKCNVSKTRLIAIGANIMSLEGNDIVTNSVISMKMQDIYVDAKLKC